MDITYNIIENNSIINLLKLCSKINKSEGRKLTSILEIAITDRRTDKLILAKTVLR